MTELSWFGFWIDHGAKGQCLHEEIEFSGCDYDVNTVLIKQLDFVE